MYGLHVYTYTMECVLYGVCTDIRMTVHIECVLYIHTDVCTYVWYGVCMYYTYVCTYIRMLCVLYTRVHRVCTVHMYVRTYGVCTVHMYVRTYGVCTVHMYVRMECVLYVFYC